MAALLTLAMVLPVNPGCPDMEHELAVVKAMTPLAGWSVAETGPLTEAFGVWWAHCQAPTLHDIEEQQSHEDAPDPPKRVSKPTDTTYRGIGSNTEQWRALVASHFPADQIDTALCVVQWESGGNPDAKNPNSSARGLFQILGSLWAPHYGVALNDLYNPETNTRIAADIWATYGWSAWAARLRGKC